MNTKTNTFATVLITAAIMLCLFAFQNVHNEPSTIKVEPTTVDWKYTKDYQVELTADQRSMIIHCGDRVVGVLPLTWKNSLGRMLLIDND